jgi:hypothetical protein
MEKIRAKGEVDPRDPQKLLLPLPFPNHTVNLVFLTIALRLIV